MTQTTTTFEVDEVELAALRAPRTDALIEAPDGPDRYRCETGSFDRYQRSLTVEPLGEGRHRVTEVTDFSLAIPIWGPLFRPLVKRQIARTTVPPTDPETGQVVARSAPWWMPPDRLDARATRVLAWLCVLSLLVGYLGTVLTQTITFAVDEFDATNSQQGLTLAAARFGIIIALVVMVLADRHGRQRYLGISAVAGSVSCALGAISPNLFVLGATQTVSRAFSTALALLLAVVAAEEMPAGARAYAASVLAMTAALGAGGAVLLLPVADLAEPAWRIVYAAPLLAVPLFIKVANSVPESRRFVRPHASVNMAGHRGRLALLAASAFFALVFLAPVTQFQNDYLRDEHAFSALMITIYTICTNTPGGIGIIVGGYLADTRGRRVVGAVGTIGGAVFWAITYLVGGVWLWLGALAGTILAALTVPALAVYGPELFPTALRGRANGWITMAGVAGSAIGLAAAGRMADHFDAIGPGIVILGVGPLIVAALVIAFYPETAHMELEELNPEDASIAVPSTPLL